MSKQSMLANKIRAMKIGKSFMVDNRSEYVIALSTARLLLDAGIVDFRIRSSKNDQGWRLTAVEI